MKIKKTYGIIILLVVVLLMSVAFFGGFGVYILPDGKSTDWGTEYFDADWWGCGLFANHAHNYHGGDLIDQEILTKSQYVSSWSGEGHSMPLYLNKQDAYVEVEIDLFGELTDNLPIVSDMWWQVEYWDGTNWAPWINHKTISPDIVDIQGHGGQLLGGFGNQPGSIDGDSFATSENYWAYFEDSGEPWKWDYLWNEPTGISGFMTGESNDAGFSIKGIHTKTIRVSLMSRMVWDDCPDGNRKMHIKDVPWARDYAKIVRGECDIVIADSGNPDPTMFEEKQTMRIQISTDYAGEDANGKDADWRVRVYNPNGLLAGDGDGVVEAGEISLVHPDGTITDGEFLIPDLAGGGTLSTENYEVKWDIPLGIVDQYPNSYGKWIFKIENTITEKDKEQTVVVKEGESLLGPVNTEVEILNEGEEVTYRTVRVTADGNPEGTNDVKEFHVTAYRWVVGGGKVEYYNDIWLASFQSGNTYYAEDDISIPFDEEYLYIESRPYDTNNLAGMMDSTGEMINPPGTNLAKLIVKAQDGNKGLSGTSITINGLYMGRTDSSGTFETSLETGLVYVVQASNTEYGSKIQQITLIDDPTTVTFEFGLVSWINILIPIIIFIVFLIVGIILPVWNIGIKAGIIIIGAVIAILVYLFLTGVIHIYGLSSIITIFRGFL